MTGTQTFQIRPAEPDDVLAIARLWDEAFPGTHTIEQRVRMMETGGRYGGIETVRVVTEPDHGIVGAAKLYRMTGHIAGTPMPMMGLAAVAVTPSRRRRGLAARLCTRAVRAAAERGDVISVLYPFRPDYYERLGWGLVGALQEYRFHTGALDIEHAGAAARVRAADLEHDADAIAACYARVAARSNGPIERDRRVWAYRLTGLDLGVVPVDAEAIWTARADPEIRPVVYDDDGAITGYALLRYVRKGSPEEHTLEVRELIAGDEAAYRGLLAHIGGQADRWPRCTHYARPDERFGDFLTDPRPPGFRDARSLYFPTARIVRGPMLRVLDVPGSLRARRFFDAGGDEPATIELAVQDPQRPANAGPWTVRLEHGGAEVEAGEPSSPDAVLETDAATFGRIFAGEIPATVAAAQRRALVDGDAAVLDRAFATRQRFWLLDEF
ncbi:MAG: GNAT family N-acetyltransferase [Longimicrobiales bacterium]